MNIQEKTKLIKSGKLTAVKNVMDFADLIKKENKKYNIFLHLNENAIEKAKEIDKRIKEKKEVGKLAGICFAVKSNISVKELVTNCASLVLEDYVSPYNATVINKLLTEDAIILGMVNMDEFACGGSGETSAYGPTKNPVDISLIPGGTSSGSAAAMSAKFCDFALGSDTGGSIRNPSSHCNVIGLKPTYGAVSRYGLIDMTMSFDCIGPITNSVEDSKIIFDIIKGEDNFDQTTKDYPKKIDDKIKTIGVVNVKDYASKEIYSEFEKKVEELKKSKKYKIEYINLPLDITIETYYIMVYTEFFSSSRKFDGRRFGRSIDEAAGPEVLRRIIGGSYITEAEHEGKFYREALKARNQIKEDFNNLFKKVDLIILPTVPKLPHKIGDKISIKEMYAYDVFTTPASIAGLPAISIPLTKINNKPLGLQIIAPEFFENKIFEFAKNI